MTRKEFVQQAYLEILGDLAAQGKPNRQIVVDAMDLAEAAADEAEKRWGPFDPARWALKEKKEKL